MTESGAPAGETMNGETLHQEVVEQQKFTVDLEKWKIILIAVLGAVGLGVTKEESGHPVILALIPLVCAYVDVLVYHNGLRILVISQFLQDGHPDAFARHYEQFCQERRSVFPLEEWALFATTIIVSVVVGAFALQPSLVGIQLRSLERVVLVVSAAVGVVGTTGARFMFEWHADKLAHWPLEVAPPKTAGFRRAMLHRSAFLALTLGIGLAAVLMAHTHDSRRLAILATASGARIDDVAPGLWPAIVHRAAASGVAVVPMSELNGPLTAEQRKTLLACEPDACAEELAQALGTRAVLVGSVQRAGDTIVCSLEIVDLGKKAVLGREVVHARNVGELLDATESAVDGIVSAWLATD